MEKTLTITRYPRALGEVSSQVAGQQWVYQLTRAFQLSPTEFGLLVNIRLCAIRPVDIETGNDLVILDRLDQVEPKATIPLNRGEFGIHPRTVQRLLLSRYPLAGGFIPVGACRADGSPHPHAGTGFAVSHVLGYPVDDAGNVAVYGLWEIPEADRHVMFELQQYRYDGATFTVEHSEMLNPEAVLPGWVFTSSPLSNSIADGDDLIGGFVGYRVGSAAATAGSGMTRWKWRDGRWRLMEFTPVPEAEGAFEPSMVRDGDNSLLFAVRGSSRSVLGEKEDPQKKSYLNDVRVWRSIDCGATWTLVLHAPMVRAASPVSINKAADGTIYVAGNPHCATDHRGKGISISIAMREILQLWPLSQERNRLLGPVLVCDGNREFGSPPFDSIWWEDHPVGLTVRLGDGQWHHMLTFRVLEQSECASDSPATPFTGTYLYEVLSTGPVKPEWVF